MGSQWEYTIEWYTGGSNFQRSAVRLISSPRYGEEDIRIQIWTNSDLSEDIIKGNQPVAVYAKIIKGTSLVLNADVTAHISVTTPSGSEREIDLKLLDTGNGGTIIFLLFKLMLINCCNFIILIPSSAH